MSCWPARPTGRRPRACCPTTSAGSSSCASSQEIDTNKDGQLDRVELTGHAVKQFLEMDINKDRFLTEDEFKKAQEAETKKMRAIIQAMQPAQPAQPQPAPAPAQPRGGQPQPAPRRSRRAWRPACRRDR